MGPEMLACDWITTSARTPAAGRRSSNRLNSANRPTAADSPDTRQREIVGGKRRSMNRSGGVIFFPINAPGMGRF